MTLPRRILGFCLLAAVQMEYLAATRAEDDPPGGTRVLIVVAREGRPGAREMFETTFTQKVTALKAACSEVEFALPEGHEGKKPDPKKKDKSVFRCIVTPGEKSVAAAGTAIAEAVLETTLKYPKYRVAVGACPGTCQYRSCPSVPDEVCWEPRMRCINDCGQ